MFLGYQNNKIKFYTSEPLDEVLYNLDKVEETENEYALKIDEYVLKDEEYEEWKEEQEKERIGNLTCTKRVLALSLQQLGVSYSDLKSLIATSEQAQLEWDLCVKLERKNPLLDLLAPQLGITSEQLDDIFENAQNLNED